MENKFLDLLQKNGQVSFVNDMFPIIFDEFENEPLNEATYEMAAEYMSQLIYSAAITGIQVVCLPKFTGDSKVGELYIADMIYKVV
jgi:hypothetical protein